MGRVLQNKTGLTKQYHGTNINIADRCWSIVSVLKISKLNEINRQNIMGDQISNVKFVIDSLFRRSAILKVRVSTAKVTSSSAIADRPRDARVTSIRKIAKWNFLATLLGA